MSRFSQKPTIGIIASQAECAKQCTNIIERNGGVSQMIASSSKQPIQVTLTHLGALLVCGETPGVYGDSELAILNAALEANMPVLCIALGMQLLNSVAGGGPVQDVPSHGLLEQNDQEVSSYHHIFITPGSKLAAIVGSGGIVRVNSRHQSGLKEPQKSPQLMASAYSLQDGVIEALESPAHQWVIAVQFHPERNKELPPHFGRLFESLVERSEDYMSSNRLQ